MSIFASTTFTEVGSKVTDVVSLMVAGGITRIELGSIHSYEPDLIQKLSVCQAEFFVHNYFPPPTQPFIVNLASPEKATRELSIRHALNSITFCRQIDARLYTFHPGFLCDPMRESTVGTNFDFVFRSEEHGIQTGELAFRRFINAVEIIASHARSEGVQVAVESEGSLSKRDYLFLQKPEEFDRFCAAVPDPIVGINLNLGHLNLASRAFGFDRFEFIDRIASRIVAMEISHNDGLEDEHRSLVRGAWYWDVVRDTRFSHIPIIIEVRNTPLEDVRQMVHWVDSERRAGKMTSIAR